MIFATRIHMSSQSIRKTVSSERWKDFINPSDAKNFICLHLRFIFTKHEAGNRYGPFSMPHCLGDGESRNSSRKLRVLGAVRVRL